MNDVWKAKEHRVKFRDRFGEDGKTRMRQQFFTPNTCKHTTIHVCSPPLVSLFSFLAIDTTTKHQSIMVNNRAFSFDLAQQVGLSSDRFPETKEEGDLALEAMSQELKRLSLTEQEQAIFDVHGFSGEVEETDEMIDAALMELEVELSSIDESDKEAYLQAKFLNEGYVKSRSFELMFIRSDRYDIKTAARTIVYHFDFKRRIFGDGEILARDVRQSDLTKEDMFIVENGGYQLFPCRDGSGRILQAISFDLKPDVAIKPESVVSVITCR